MPGQDHACTHYTRKVCYILTEKPCATQLDIDRAESIDGTEHDGGRTNRTAVSCSSGRLPRPELQ
eukprot:6468965-Alexandrium_andersonii.AAC.1